LQLFIANGSAITTNETLHLTWVQ